MPIDSSIYQNAGPKPLDLNSLINMARGAQRLQGESAMGDIYAGATNPDGTLDTGKLGSATNMQRAGVMAPELAAQTQARAQGQQHIDRGKLDNLREWWKTLDQQLYSHLNDENLDHRKVFDSIHGLIGHKSSELNGGLFTPQMAVKTMQQFYGQDGNPLPPDRIRKVLGQFHQRVQDHLASSEYVPVGVGPDGSQLYMMRNGSIARDAAMSRGPGAPGGPQGAPGAQPGGPGVPVQQPGGAPAVPFTPPAGFTEAASGIGAQSASAAGALTAANDTSMVRKAQLGNLEDDLKNFTSGPGADWTKFAKAWVNRNVPLPSNWQFDPKSIASQEQFNKQAAMLAQSQFSAIGGTGTDAKFNSAFTTSPNETLSKLGNQGIMRLLKGNEDAIQAKNAAWQKWLKTGHGPQTYAQFQDEFNARFDPRAFQFKYIPKAERQAYIDRMDPADRERFVADLTHAHRQGWIKFGAE